jgi:hypothetical protein
MIFFDKDGYTHNPSLTTELIKARYNNAYGKNASAKDVEGHLPRSLETFYSFIKSNDGEKYLSATDDSAKESNIMSLVRGGDQDTNRLLLTYHWSRFVNDGKIVYKVRPAKTEFLRDIELHIPGNMLVAPHKEFLISLPFGAISTDLGYLVNIYVSSEPFTPEAYNNNILRTDGGVGAIIKEHGHSIKRVIRAMGIFHKNQHDPSGDTAYYHLPVVENMDVTEQFELMMSLSPHALVDSVKVVFNMVLNFCAYLSTKDPDVQNVLGIHYTASSNEKKARQTEVKNRLYGYSYKDVGRIYDERRTYENRGSSGKTVLKRFKVRTHIRAQWFGPKTNGPGTEQRLIIIEEHEKGSLGELTPRTVDVGI